MIGLSYGNLASSGVGFDLDAQAFITAAGITDSTEQDAVNQLVLDLKGIGSTTNNTNQWSKHYALYPISPTSLSAASYNLKNPSLYQITWYNSPTHGATGITGNGLNMYGNTNFNPNTIASQNDFGITADIATLGVEVSGSIGCYGGGIFCEIQARYLAGNQYRNASSSATRITGTSADTGVWTVSRTASNLQTQYINGVSDATETGVSGAHPNYNITLMARNEAGTIRLYSARRYRFWGIHQGLTATEAKDYYDAIDKYNTALGR